MRRSLKGWWKRMELARYGIARRRRVQRGECVHGAHRAVLSAPWKGVQPSGLHHTGLVLR